MARPTAPPPTSRIAPSPQSSHFSRRSSSVRSLLARLAALLLVLPILIAPVALHANPDAAPDTDPVAADTGTPSADAAPTTRSTDSGTDSTDTDTTATETDASAQSADADATSDGRSLSELKSEGTGHSPWEILGLSLQSLLGLLFLLGIAFLMSQRRDAIDWSLVAWGVAIQAAFAAIIFGIPFMQTVFRIANEAVTQLLNFTDAGSRFLFASNVTQTWEPGLKNFAFQVLPTIIFFSSLMTILYYLGVMQAIVRFFAHAMRKVMDLSGAESLSASANIFVGQTEAPLVVKPYVEKMTRSELMVVMTGGFATVAGGVMAIYVGMLKDAFPDIAGHLVAASIMSAPGALVIAKIIYPEVDDPETKGDFEIDFEQKDANSLDAASRGATEGLNLAMNVAAMLLAFLALIEMFNYLIGLPSMLWNQATLQQFATFYGETKSLTIPEGCAPSDASLGDARGCVEQMAAATSGMTDAPGASLWPVITLETIFGYLFWPFAFAMGVPPADCAQIGSLLGEKMIVNELVAYASLAEMLNQGAQLQQRSVVIAIYALCGFANFGSIGIQLGGIGGIAPSRKGDLAEIALRAMIGGTLAAFMTGTLAGIGILFA